MALHSEKYFLLLNILPAGCTAVHRYDATVQSNRVLDQHHHYMKIETMSNEKRKVHYCSRCSYFFFCMWHSRQVTEKGGKGQAPTPTLIVKPALKVVSRSVTVGKPNVNPFCRFPNNVYSIGLLCSVMCRKCKGSDSLCFMFFNVPFTCFVCVCFCCFGITMNECYSLDPVQCVLLGMSLSR